MALVEWRELAEHERQRLFARLGAAREIGEDGRPRYGGDPFFEDVIGVLEAALKFSAEIPEVEARRAVGAALFAEGTRALNAETFLREVERHVAAFLGTERRPYVLVGRILARHFEGLTETEISGCRLTFYRRVPESFLEGHRWAEDRTLHLVPGGRRSSPLSASRSTVVTIEAGGRSESEAALRAQPALTLKRGI